MKFEKQLSSWLRENAKDLSPECIVFAQLHGSTEELLTLSTEITNPESDVLKSSLNTLGLVYGPVFNKIYETYQVAKKEAASALSGSSLSDEYKSKLKQVMIVDPYLVSIDLGPDNIGLNAFIPAYSYALAVSEHVSGQFKTLVLNSKNSTRVEELDKESTKLIHSYVKQLGSLPERVVLNSINLFLDRAEHEQFTSLNKVYFETNGKPRPGSIGDTPSISCLKLAFFKSMMSLDSPEAKLLQDVLTLSGRDTKMEHLSPSIQ